MIPGPLFFLLSICLLLFFSRAASSSARFVVSYQYTSLRNKKVINRDTTEMDTALVVRRKLSEEEKWPKSRPRISRFIFGEIPEIW